MSRQTWSASRRGWVETDTNRVVVGWFAAALAIAVLVVLVRGLFA